MALPSSGPLALTDIQTEFGGANPIGMNEYYAGGGLVPAGTSGTYGAVPSSGALSVQNFYGTSNFVPVYVEDVFSTYLYLGTGGTIYVTNGIDLLTNGGLVWNKARNSSGNYTGWHWWLDTNRGTQESLHSNNTNPQFNNSEINSWLNNGYLIGGQVNINQPGVTYASWTFRKQPKFFDVVTYTGNGVSGRSIAHNLGSIPGAIIIKNTSSSTNWAFALATDVNNWSGTSKLLCLNTSDVDYSGPTYSNGSVADATSSTFTVVGFSGNQLNVNQSGQTYVAYLFASNAGGFGLSGTDNVITCGSYTGDGSSGQAITLGFEPQWILIKNASATSNWIVTDVMRGWSMGLYDSSLSPNLTNAESTTDYIGYPTATGFVTGSNNFTNQSGATFIYIAIRRGPMKVPTVGTSVFTPADSGNDSAATDMNFPVDAFWETNWAGSIYNTSTATRLWGNGNMLRTSDYVVANGFFSSLFSNTRQNFYAGGIWGGGTQVSQYGFRRAPKFMDICAFTVGSGSTNHNLTVTPELIIYKSLNSNVDWYVCVSTNGLGILNSDSAWIATGSGSGLGSSWANATSTTISRGSWGYGTNNNMVAYLFATCPGVSKVGSFTGTGSLQTINCGFTTGVRFILIKRTDSTGDWYLYDSVRGISSGNDPYNLLNSSAANVNGTNYVDTTSVGFQVTAAASGTVNVSGGAYIFLAIA
jgi:hypothetical protein